MSKYATSEVGFELVGYVTGQRSALYLPLLYEGA